VSLLRCPELCFRLTPGALFAQGISADTRWGVYDAPVLCLAAEKGSERALKALLDAHANHALADKKGLTAAHYAAHFGLVACLRLLVDAGAQLEAKANGAFTPLHCAAQEGHPSAAHCCSPWAATPAYALNTAKRR